MMGQGDLAGLRTAATPDQRRAGSRVMRMAEGALWPALQGGTAAYRLDRSDLQRFVFIQRRQEARQAAGEQRLAGAGWPGQQQVVNGYKTRLETCS